MKHQRPKLYHYTGPNKTWIRCNVCHQYERPVVEFENMEQHITCYHPEQCYWSLDGCPCINLKTLRTADRLYLLRKQFPRLKIAG